jgi:phosphoribosylformimino-5-aminoimidazole carboxamide ribotide isomerase
VIPGIDLRDGQVVRLRHGDLDHTTVYDEDPVAVAERWEAAGAQRLHVIDIDGAMSGEPRHRDVITRIVSAVRMAVQVGGGIRTMDTLRAWLDAGASRVLVGTAAIGDPDFLRLALDTVGESVVVALDARDREVRVSGWRESSGIDLVEAAVQLAEAGVPRLLVTDIGRDGTLDGPNLELVAEVARACGVPVISAGGVASLADIRALAELEPAGVEAAVVGKALYTGDLDLAEALQTVS